MGSQSDIELRDLKRVQLLEKQKMLRERLEAIKRDIGRGLDRDSGEQALQLENAEVLDEIGRVTTKELESITSELARLN